MELWSDPGYAYLLFNKLSYYPHDATVKFTQYDFNVRSVVAIAPAARQYRPADAEGS